MVSALVEGCKSARSRHLGIHSPEKDQADEFTLSRLRPLFVPLDQLENSHTTLLATSDLVDPTW